jgi:hypothetical protein
VEDHHLPHHTRISAVIVALLVVSQTTAALAQDSPDVQSIVNAVVARTVAVKGYTADLSLHVKMHSFPFVGMTFNGATAYQRPGKFAVTLHTLPAIAKAFAKVSGDAGDPAAWGARYDIAMVNDSQALPGQITLRLTPRESCQVAYALVNVDVTSKTIQRMEWHYVSGGRIDVDERYALLNGILISAGQTAEITMPGIHATASSTLSNIVVQTDVAVTPSFNSP